MVLEVEGGGGLESVLGGCVPPRPPKIDPILEVFYIQSDTLF